MKKINLILTLFCCLVITGCGNQPNKDSADLDINQGINGNATIEKESTTDKQTVKLDVENVNNNLPLTMEVEEYDTKLQTIAYRLWFDFMGKFEASGQISDAFFTRFDLLEGDEEEFVVAAVFEVHLEEGKRSAIGTWGKEYKDGLVDGIVWKMHIMKEGERTYTLEKIEPSTDIKIGLPPVQSMEEYQKEAGVEQPSEKNRYEIVNGFLKVTYDNGNDWMEVPVMIDELFEGEYNGSEKYLIDGSYIISPDRTAFVVGGNHDLRLLQSTDQGKSWEEVVVTDQIQGVRMRLLGFTSDQDGYLIVSAGRTMSSEGHLVYRTNDGGKSWYMAGGVDDVFSLVTGGGFVNDQIGFISFGAFNYQDQPSRPRIYRTGDGGENWEEAKVPIPDKYKGVFTVAETPVFNGSHGTMLVNQGPNGDYLGGKVLAKFTSSDEGRTWNFSSLVDPDRVLLKDF